MISVLDIDDSFFKDETLSHSIRVSQLCYHFGEFLNYSNEDLKNLALGGVLHDIGKFYIPVETLYKIEVLTKDELTLVKNHVQLASTGLNLDKLPTPVFNMVMQHHERIDGNGYPQQLIGVEIDPLAKILSIIDVYDALMNPRCYRSDVKSLEETFEILDRMKGKQLDVNLVDSFKLFIKKTLEK